MSGSYPTRDSSDGHSNPSSKRKGKSTNRDGRSKDTVYGYDEGGPMSDGLPIYNKSGYPEDNPRPLAAPNLRSLNDVGQYLPVQQEQFNKYSVAPLAAHPQGGNQSALYAMNSNSDNVTTAAAMESFNKTRTAVSQGSLFNGAVSATSTVVNVFNFHSAKASPSNYPQNLMSSQSMDRSSQGYHSHSDHPAPTMRPSISDPYNQASGGDARYRYPASRDAEPRSVHQPKPYPYNHEKGSKTIHPSDSEEQFQRERNLRHDHSGLYEDSNFSRPLQYLPNPEQHNSSIAKDNQDIASQPPPRRLREDKRQSETRIQGWNAEEEELSREKTPKAYSNIPQPPITSMLPQHTSWTRKDDEPIYGSPKTYSNMPRLQTKTSSSESVQTVRQGVVGRQWSKDQDNDLERDRNWTDPINYGSSSLNPHASSNPSSLSLTTSKGSSDPINYGSTSLNPHASSNPSSLSSTTSKGSSSNSPLTSSALSSQPRQNSQSGRAANQEIQDISLYSGHYSSPRDPRDQRRAADIHNDDENDAPERSPPPTREVSHPAQRSHGGTWHSSASDGFQPQISSRNQPRQEDIANQNWSKPSNQLSPGRNFPNNYSSNSLTGEGRPVSDHPIVHVAPYSSGFQNSPNQMAPGSWPNPYGSPSSTASGSIFPSTGNYSQPPAGHPSHYQNDLSQQMAQTSLSTRGPLMPIPETRQQFYANSTVSSRVSRTSMSTIPGKCIPLGNPYLCPLRPKAENEGRKRRKPIDAESHISSYMASDIVNQDTTPLWSPSPKLLGSDRQRRGIEVGDLGYMDESGEFTTIFNIFYSHEANKHRGASPPNYHHFQPLEANNHEAVKKVDISKRRFYLSENITRNDKSPPGHFEFSLKKKCGRRGAIIVLPHGGSTSTLRGKFFQLPNVKKYFRENAASWYQHARTRPDTQNLSNGSLLFIQGTHVAQTWGIATFFSRDDVRESQRILFLPNNSNPYEYQWEWYSKEWRVRTGPSAEELSAMYGRQPPPQNQCIGIMASSVFLDDDTWRAYFSETNDRSSVSPATRGIYNPFRWITRTRSSASLNSSIIRVQPHTGRRYLDSIQENQRGLHDGNDFELFRL